jgi:ribose/xylose/arabinose/galactoside ABC-type transport system permease subunit
MAQRAFAFPDPEAPVEYGLRVPAYLENASWRQAASWAWAGLVALLFAVTAMWGVGIGGEQFSRELGHAYLTVLPALMAVVLFRQGGVDLSMGAVAGTAAAVCASLVQGGEVPPQVGLVVGMLAALAFGLAHAALVGFLRVPGFLATVFSMLIGRSVVLSITQGRSIFLPELRPMADSVTPDLVGWALVAAVFVVALLLFQLRGPRDPGTAPSWARQSLALGLPYLASSLVAGATGLLLMFYVGAATTSHGQGLEQDAVIAVILGGTWLAGRAANVVGTLLGALALAALQADLAMANVKPATGFRVEAELALFFLVVGVVFHMLVGGAYAQRKSAASAPAAMPPIPG